MSSALTEAKLSGSHLEANTSIEVSVSLPPSRLPTGTSPRYTASWPGPFVWMTATGGSGGACSLPPCVPRTQRGPDCRIPHILNLPSSPTATPIRERWKSTDGESLLSSCSSKGRDSANWRRCSPPGGPSSDGDRFFEPTRRAGGPPRRSLPCPDPAVGSYLPTARGRKTQGL